MQEDYFPCSKEGYYSFFDIASYELSLKLSRERLNCIKKLSPDILDTAKKCSLMEDIRTVNSFLERIISGTEIHRIFDFYDVVNTVILLNASFELKILDTLLTQKLRRDIGRKEFKKLKHCLICVGNVISPQSSVFASFLLNFPRLVELGLALCVAFYFVKALTAQEGSTQQLVWAIGFALFLAMFPILLHYIQLLFSKTSRQKLKYQCGYLHPMRNKDYLSELAKKKVEH